MIELSKRWLYNSQRHEAIFVSDVGKRNKEREMNHKLLFLFTAEILFYYFII